MSCLWNTSKVPVFQLYEKYSAFSFFGSEQNRGGCNCVWSDFFRSPELLSISIFCCWTLASPSWKMAITVPCSCRWSSGVSICKSVLSWIGFPKKHNFQKNYLEILKLNSDLAQGKSIASNWIDDNWLLDKWSSSFARGDFWKVTFF